MQTDDVPSYTLIDLIRVRAEALESERAQHAKTRAQLRVALGLIVLLILAQVIVVLH